MTPPLILPLVAARQRGWARSSAVTVSSSFERKLQKLRR